MSRGIETRCITVRKLSERLGWEIGHCYKLLSTPVGPRFSWYSACTLPEEIQRRIAVLDMVAIEGVVPSIGARWRRYATGYCLYTLDPWRPFEDLLATGLLTHIKEKTDG